MRKHPNDIPMWPNHLELMEFSTDLAREPTILSDVSFHRAANYTRSKLRVHACSDSVTKPNIY
jgi:hypothetical protein